ncbi:MAG TPA: preprotein translocase subunit SecG [Candidatus Saccharimonadia bacterium]|nr:preprotein translocase subunit SecG [Candidatus Saccharimonadia bacterium]
MRNLFNAITIISAIMMMLFILIQSRGQSLGATFGGDTNYYRSRRGAEAVVFNATIIFAVLFVLSVIFSILLKK